MNSFFIISMQTHHHYRCVGVCMYSWIFVFSFLLPPRLTQNYRMQSCWHGDTRTDTQHKSSTHTPFPWQPRQQHVAQAWTWAASAAAAVSEDDGWEGRSPICRAKAEICCPDTSCRQPSHSGRRDWRSAAQLRRWHANTQESCFATASAVWVTINNCSSPAEAQSFFLFFFLQM